MPVVAAVTYANWEVMWIRSDGRVARKKFGRNLAEAEELYIKALHAGKRAVTLRSCNVAFPPPDKYADTEKVAIGRSKRTGKVVYRHELTEPRRYVGKMHAVNRKGVWWCCYCRKMRRFVKRKGFRYRGQWVDEPHYGCPMCSIMHTNGSVRRYNPIASEIALRSSRTRGGRRRGRT